MKITEDQLEQQCMEWFQHQGYEYLYGPDIAHDGDNPIRADYREVVLKDRLLSQLQIINPQFPRSALEDAVHKVVNPESPVLIHNNRAFHKLLLEGVPVEYRPSPPVPLPEGEGGRRSDEGKYTDEVISDHVQLIDFNNPDNNRFLVVNQFTVQGAKKLRRPDVIIFINGLPVAVIELKNPADENADVWSAFNQFQTYKEEIPDLFVYNTALIVSDGITARIGSLTADQERFMPWRTIRNENDKPLLEYELENVVRGFFDKELFLDYVRHFVLFEQDDGKTIKKIAGYHQFHAVRAAVEATVIAATAGRTAPSPPAPLPGSEGRIIQFDRWEIEALAAETGVEYDYHGKFRFSDLKARARELRQRQTPAEELGWELFRNRRFMGLKFRRQHQYGPYILDFYCVEKRLILEFDGDVHDSEMQRRHDHKRDAYLSSMGNTVLRFPNDYILNQTEAFLDKLKAFIEQPPTVHESASYFPSPAWRGAGGEASNLPSPAWLKFTLIFFVTQLGSCFTLSE
ncbi:MAG: DUF559 domain-containing protein [Pontiellaceae bacterium]|nr:DUF559 domain-containing protein [Pontiellaceae bacterium]